LRLTAIALALLSLAIGGCGDDGDDASENAQTSPGAGDQVQTAAEESDTTSQTAPSEGHASNGKAPSRTEYIRRADRICRSAQAAIAARSAEYRDLTAAVAQGKIERQEYVRRAGQETERSGAIAQRAVIDLKELPPPTSRRDAIEAYLQGATKQSAALTAQGAALRQGDTEELAELNRRIAEASQQTRRAARRVGFRICGGGS
jgi:hypothetical protein